MRRRAKNPYAAGVLKTVLYRHKRAEDCLEAWHGRAEEERAHVVLVLLLQLLGEVLDGKERLTIAKRLRQGHIVLCEVLFRERVLLVEDRPKLRTSDKAPYFIALKETVEIRIMSLLAGDLSHAGHEGSHEPMQRGRL